MSNHELVTAATAAVQLPVTHAHAKAARIAALQAAIVTGTDQTFEAFGIIERITPEGDVIKIKDGVESPEADRIIKGMLADLANTNRMRIWSETPEIGMA